MSVGAEDGCGDLAILSDDLDAAARRRLWFLHHIIVGTGLSDVEAALSRAERLEEFVLRGSSARRASSGRDDLASAGVHSDVDAGAEARSGHQKHANGPSDLERRLPDPPQAVALSLSAASSRATTQTQANRSAVKRALAENPVLGPQVRDRFIKEAARNPDNRHLARTFGLTVRQAHAARVAFRRLIAQINRVQDAPARGGDEGGAKKPDPTPHRVVAHAGKRGERVPRIAADRGTELRMQEEFLAQKPSTPATMEDVVRYLRQIGDVVVSEGDEYVVNYRLRLSRAALITRAEEKRRQRGLRPLVVASAAPSHFASAENTPSDTTTQHFPR